MMIKWAQFPFVPVTLVFMLGIGLNLWLKWESTLGLFGFVASVCLTGCFFFMARRRKSAFLFNLSGVAGLLSFALVGFSLVSLKTARNYPENLYNQTGEITHYTGKVNDFILEKPTVFQTTLKVNQVKINGRWLDVSGNVQLSVRKEKILNPLQYGDVLLIKGSPRIVPAPLNPGQFNYRTYLASQQIYHQHYLYPGQFEMLGREVSNPIMALSMQLRTNLDKLLKKLVPGQREYGIASALVLGIKDQLDNEIKATYANTGTMHVLAVSGLHIGLVFMLLNFGLKKLNKTFAQRLLVAVIILAVVWAYAFITALSASVLRAAVMFTILMGAQVLLKKTNMYNTLAVAAFLLLFLNPYYLLDVGFQLSFLAVLAIVYLFPRLHQLYYPETRLGRQGWSLICVSLAAQIGTFPLSLFYFHQFPVYFLLTNLVAVPLSSGILIVGLAVILLGWVPVLGPALGWLMKWSLFVMNEAMIWLEQLPFAQISRIPFTGLQMVLTVAMLLVILFFLARPRFKLVVLACGLLLLFSGSRMREKFLTSGKNRLIIFAVPGKSVWGFFNGPEATILADSGFQQNKQQIGFTLEPIFLAHQTHEIHFQTWNNSEQAKIAMENQGETAMVVWQGLKIIAIKDRINYQLKQPLVLDLLVLQNNVYLTPEELSRNFQPKLVIFDSSNAGWYVNWLSKKLKTAGIPYHDVNTHGAFSSFQ